MELRLNSALGPEWFKLLMEQDIFAHLFEAVEDFPRQRRAIEAEPESPQWAQDLAACAWAERNAIPVITEFLQGMCSDPWSALGDVDLRNVAANTALIQRVVHAYALMAVLSDGGGRAELRQMLCPDAISRARRQTEQEAEEAELQASFDLAIYEGKWNAPGERQPAAVTRKETSYGAHKKDGKYNTSNWREQEDGDGVRLDTVARAHEQIEPLQKDEERLAPMFPANEPFHKPPDWLALLRPCSTIELAIRRAEVRKLGKIAGLKKDHTKFLEQLIFEGAKQEDNPAAWYAIRQSRRGKLLQEVQGLLERRDGNLFLP